MWGHCAAWDWNRSWNSIRRMPGRSGRGTPQPHQDFGRRPGDRRKRGRGSRHTASAVVTWDKPAFFSASLEGRYVGSRTDDDLETIRLESFFVTGLRFNAPAVVTVDRLHQGRESIQCRIPRHPGSQRAGRSRCAPVDHRRRCARTAWSASAISPTPTRQPGRSESDVGFACQEVSCAFRANADRSPRWMDVVRVSLGIRLHRRSERVREVHAAPDHRRSADCRPAGRVRFEGGSPSAGSGRAGGAGARHLPWMTVVDNVAFGLKLAGMAKTPERRARATAFLDRVGLGRSRSTTRTSYPVGMRQRVGIGRAFVSGRAGAAHGRALRRARCPDPLGAAGRAARDLERRSASWWCSSPTTSKRRCCWPTGSWS